MNKSQLREFALWAKGHLEEQIRFSCERIGISANGIKPLIASGSVYRLEGFSEVYDASFARKRERLVRSIQNNEFGLNHVIEEVAYTWFNRLVALRYMELNRYIPHGYRVLSSEIAGQVEPDVLKHINNIASELLVNVQEIRDLLGKNQLESAYRKVLLKQCNVLHDILPMLFEQEQDYTELLLPNVLLGQGAIIDRLTQLDEDNFKDVEIIGWLYQYYISTKKDEYFSSPEKASKDTIPAATQIFTPDWIVRYMVDNSLGKLWLDSYPESGLKGKLKYYLEPAEQTPEVQAQLSSFIEKNLRVENIRFLEPCAGSGHILVYAFDVFYQMYLEQGYRKSDIPSLILKNNLFGLDIDKRASQLAAFSLMMKSRSVDPNIFNKKIEMNVYEILETNTVSRDFIQLINPEKMSKEDLLRYKQQMNYLLDLFKDAKLFGSLLEVDHHIDYDILYHVLESDKDSILGSEYYDTYRHILKQAEVLDRKYDVVVTNPPYMGRGKMPGRLTAFVDSKYPRSKNDLFACFIEREISQIKRYRYLSIVTMQSWMFLSSFEDLRVHLVKSHSISAMMHMDNMVLGIAFGTSATIFQKGIKNLSGKYQYTEMSDIVNNEPIKYPVLNSRFKSKSTLEYAKIPGSPIAYWLSKKEIEIFSESENIGVHIDPRIGLITGNNDRFLRLWHEVYHDNILFGCRTISQSIESKKKFFPYSKGGEFRKWWGNNEYIVNWYNDGYEMKCDNYSGERVRSHNYNGDLSFMSGVTWTSVTSSKFSCRYLPEGFLFDAAGPLCHVKSRDKLKYILGLFSSNYALKTLAVLNPTINMHPGYLLSLPLIYTSSDVIENQVNELVAECVNISKLDWDSFETSWDFVKHPFLNYKSEGLRDAYNQWEQFTTSQFNRLKFNEEELNRIFIDIYGLQEELTPEVEDKDIEASCRHADKGRDVRSFISYLVGCLFGRYSLDQEGLVYAGGDFDLSKYTSYSVDKDNIIPITTIHGLSDDLASQVMNLVKIIYGEKTYYENLEFIAEGIGKRSDETAADTIRRYLENDFYKDHCRIYQKRPIYWMLSSGKKNGFKALFYLHRYDKNLLANVVSKYYYPHQQRLNQLIIELQGSIEKASTSERARLTKQLNTLLGQREEMEDYYHVLYYKSQQYIEMDLDDGVKKNYELFQNITVKTDRNQEIKKDLLEKI